MKKGQSLNASKILEYSISAYLLFVQLTLISLLVACCLLFQSLPELYRSPKDSLPRLDCDFELVRQTRATILITVPDVCEWLTVIKHAEHPTDPAKTA